MVVHLAAGLDDWFKQNGFPGVLKVDGTSGGYGVRIVSTLAEAKEAYAALSVPVSLPCAVKRLLVDRNETYLMPALRRVPPVVNVQRFIVGEEVTCTAACWQGEVLGWVALRVIRNSGQVGWSTVVQVTDDPNVLLAIKKNMPEAFGSPASTGLTLLSSGAPGGLICWKLIPGPPRRRICVPRPGRWHLLVAPRP